MPLGKAALIYSQKIEETLKIFVQDIASYIGTYYKVHNVIYSIHNWGEPERAPHWAVVDVIVASVACPDCER